MKAFILNGGLGHSMGVITKEHPKQHQLHLNTFGEISNAMGL